MPSLSEFEKWLSTGQVSKRLGYSRQGATDLAHSRKIRAVKTAAGWLYDPHSVDLFDAERQARESERSIEEARKSDPNQTEREIRESEESIKQARK